MAVFEDQITIARSPEVVFNYLTTPRNIEQVAAGDTGMTFIEAPEQFHQGAVIQFRIMVMGQVRTSVHEIIEFDRPNRFVEKLVEGSLKSWLHEHLFESDGEGTRVTDRITFDPPGGLLGMIATEDKILDQLEDGFFSRNRLLKKFLEQEA